MDFDLAVDRLERDHSHLRRAQKQRTAQNQRARAQAERRKREYAKLQAAKALKENKLRHVTDLVDRCERELGVTSISTKDPTLNLRPTSIHGDGDKIALPPSVLESLMALRDAAEGAGGGGVGSGGVGGQQQQPWTFRVGIPDPNYDAKRDFPKSDALKTIMERYSGEDDGADNDDEDDDDEEVVHMAYLEELSHRYLSYTHCTVVEFTQEEGNVGLPRGIATALLRGGGPVRSSSSSKDDDAKVDEEGYVVPHTRTVDPATSVAKSEGDGDDSDPMDLDVPDDDSSGAVPAAGDTADAPVPAPIDDEDGGERTPGHPAYGAFDVPSGEVELTLVRLPKGTGCTLVPTVEALKRGFANLKDVKAVLEQSLIRTRATLSVNDVVHTWHRGTKFDLRVSSVTPGLFGAISCINTDIEVDIGPAEGSEVEGSNPSSDASAVDASIPSTKPTAAATAATGAPGGGYTLKELASASASSSALASSSASPPTTAASVEASLPPEPPTDRTEGVCTIMIRGDGAAGKRRFDVDVARVSDLYNFAGQVLRSAVGDAAGEKGDGTGKQVGAFRLVTRYPRKIYALSDNTLSDEGIPGGQHVFLVERI